MKDSNQKPREFWIFQHRDGDTVIEYDPGNPEFTHVIEKSAYDQISAEREILGKIIAQAPNEGEIIPLAETVRQGLIEGEGS